MEDPATPVLHDKPYSNWNVNVGTVKKSHAANRLPVILKECIAGLH
jgi:hypothetical protein